MNKLQIARLNIRPTPGRSGSPVVVVTLWNGDVMTVGEDSLQTGSAEFYPRMYHGITDLQFWAFREFFERIDTFLNLRIRVEVKGNEDS